MQHLRISSILLIFLSFTGFISTASAEIKISNITGESSKINFIANGNNSSLQIFGGFAGLDNVVGTGCEHKDNVTACDNCKANGTTFAMCNQHRAYLTLRLQITISSTSLAPSSGTSRFIPKIEPVITGTGSIGAISAIVNPTEVSGPNQPATISVTWQQLCEAVEDTDFDSTQKANCNIDTQQSFRIGFDSSTDGLTSGGGTGGGTTGGAGAATDADDSTTISISFANPAATYGSEQTTDPGDCKNGLCNFTLRPGDKKAFVENVKIVSPLVGNPHAPEYMLLYCDETDDFTQITQSTPTARLPVSSSNITENEVTDFTNGKTYSCHGALEDEAGNIGAFFRGAKTGCPSDTPTPGDTCRQVTPDDVIGLFSKDANCFIATAAYGSPMEAHVQRLRDFRNKFLAPSFIGRAFVKLYYAVSPPLARWIAQDPDRRSTARALLTPVVWSVSVFMNWSWTLGLAVLFGCGFLALRRKFL